ncbi:MAG: 2-C-methyl-D-erythritol 4-phosphate cytidylyltransferase, partial [Verrucomicrobia bacterium]|nr:2-C-methyl-D-erythritol 4-phosphate cytidylyltransferase [Verrucomicrobiota bacterium]
MKKYLVLLASGTGMRFGTDCPKQFVKIGGKMIIEYTMASCDCGIFDEIILVVSEPYVVQMRQVVISNKYKVPVRVVEGGNSRIESCGRGLAVIGDEEALVIVHNGVQPFVGKKSFVNCISALGKYSAVTCGVKCVYTVLETDTNQVLISTPDRSKVYSDMGPEGFRISL